MAGGSERLVVVSGSSVTSILLFFCKFLIKKSFILDSKSRFPIKRPAANHCRLTTNHYALTTAT
jgi:hypothetical protein